MIKGLINALEMPTMASATNVITIFHICKFFSSKFRMQVLAPERVEPEQKKRPRQMRARGVGSSIFSCRLCGGRRDQLSAPPSVGSAFMQSSVVLVLFGGLGAGYRCKVVHHTRSKPEIALHSGFVWLNRDANDFRTIGLK